MIIDKLENISMYRVVPDHVIDFVKSLSHLSLGRYELIDQDYANVEEYITKSLDNAKFEAHNNYIDIQILTSGTERIYYKSVSEVEIDMPYDSQKDIMFFKDKVEGAEYVTLDGSNFAMIFPHEAHAPQVTSNSNIDLVKKVVVKVRV